MRGDPRDCIVTSEGFGDVSAPIAGSGLLDDLDPHARFAHLLGHALLDDESKLKVAGAQAGGGYLA